MNADELRNYRTYFDYSLRELSLLTGLSHTLISKYEKGLIPISRESENKLEKALGICGEKKTPSEIDVHVDYIRLTYFGGTLKGIKEKVLDCPEGVAFPFTESSLYGYEGYYSFGASRVYCSDKRPQQGIMLELSGKALAEMKQYFEEDELEMTVNKWLSIITDLDYCEANGIGTRINCSRFDLAIDELSRPEGNYNLHDLKYKRDHDPDLISTPLVNGHDIEKFKKGVSQGLTLYFGSRTSPFYLRMYEKAKQIAATSYFSPDYQTFENVTENAMIEHGIINRYEMELAGKYALDALEHLDERYDITQYAIDLLLSKVEVYSRVQLENGRTRRVYDYDFYSVFGNYKKIEVLGNRTPTSVEQSKKWVESQVSGTLLMLKEINGQVWFDHWMHEMLEKAELTTKQETKVNFEKMKKKPRTFSKE